MLRTFAVLALLVLAPLAHAQRLELDAKDIDASLKREWYGVYLQGKKIGFGNVGRERDGDEILEFERMKLKMVAFGQKVEMELKQSFRFDSQPPYKLRSADYYEDTGAGVLTIKYQRGDNGFNVITTTPKNVNRTFLQAPDFTLADALGTEIWLRRQPKEGSKFVASLLDLKDQKLDEDSKKLLAIKSTKVNGVDVRYYEVESTSKLKFVTSVSLHDAAGIMISGKMGPFEMRAESEEQAKNTEYAQDIYVFGLAKVDRALGDPSRVTELILEVEGAEVQDLVSGPRQSVAVEGGKRLLKLGARYGKETRATAQEIAECSSETITYPISNAKVKELAAKAVGGATSPEEKVQNLIRFVHESIKPKYTAAYPNIYDVLERRTGDCKTYALLFTTLARANGLAARQVQGFYYTGDDHKSFGGHAWNEVVLGGVWVPVDCAMNEREISATHVSFGEMNLAAKNALNTIGKLSFKVVEVKSK